MMEFDSIHSDIQELLIMIPFESMFVQSQSNVQRKKESGKWKRNTMPVVKFMLDYDEDVKAKSKENRRKNKKQKRKRKNRICFLPNTQYDNIIIRYCFYFMS